MKAITTRTSSLRVLRLLLVLFVGGHLVFMLAPFVNLEYLYAIAARMLYEAKTQSFFQFYPSNVASPILAVVGIVPIYGLLGVSEFSARLFSLLNAVAAIALLYWGTTRFYGSKKALLAATVLALNPLFWLYSGLAYTDAPFTFLTTLVMFSALSAMERPNIWRHIASAVVLGFSGLAKYNAGLFALPIGTALMGHILAERGREGRGIYWIKVLVAYPLVAGIIVVPYLIWLYSELGYVLHSQFVGMHGIQFWEVFSLRTTILRFLAYLGWLGIFAGPLIVFVVGDLYSMLGKRKATAGMIVLAIIAIIATPDLARALSTGEPYLGEFQLGWISFLFSNKLILSVLVFGLTFFGLLLAVSIAIWCQSSSVKRLLGIWVLFVIAEQALFRGAQRYALYVLPALAIYLADVTITNGEIRPSIPARGALALFLGMSLALSVFNSAYFAEEGYAAADVAGFINANRLRVTSSDSWGGGIGPHSGYLIDGALQVALNTDFPSYITAILRRNDNPAGIVFERNVSLLGIVFKRFAVLEYRTD